MEALLRYPVPDPEIQAPDLGIPAPVLGIPAPVLESLAPVLESLIPDPERTAAGTECPETARRKAAAGAQNNNPACYTHPFKSLI
jgi:hypothetical protein